MFGTKKSQTQPEPVETIAAQEHKQSIGNQVMEALGVGENGTGLDEESEILMPKQNQRQLEAEGVVKEMYPTLSAPCFTVGVRTDVLNKPYERGDIVLFQRDDGNERFYAKRIVGMPGDVLEIKHGQTYINGVEYEESYLNETPEDLDFGPFQVPEDHYFMMGDNRNNSYDSRYWDEHFVPANKVMSKVYLHFHLGLSDKDSQDDMAAQKGEN